MKLKLHNSFFIILSLIFGPAIYGQNIALLQQYNGQYDFVFIGNTLNTVENNNTGGEPEPPCTILTSSSASLNLQPGDDIENAYLYWAGSGTGDFNVRLNGQGISAERTFSIINSAGFRCFSAFADVTSQIRNTGNGLYTLSDLDLQNVIEPYCPSGGNFGGWAIVIVYKNATLPVNQLNLYDGLQRIPNAITITLNSLNVIDNQGAKIAFLAWEGDKNIAINETLRINGSILQNELNPGNNAFNGTNSFTNTSNLYNMDMDVYDIQNNIHPGDTTAQIQLTSGQDFVMINAIVTKLNSSLPDASVSIDRIDMACNSREVLVDYTVYNLNSTAILQQGVPVAIYADGIVLGSIVTLAPIPIGGSESGTVSLLIPATISDDFELLFAVDDIGNGSGIVIENNENNNDAHLQVSLAVFQPLPTVVPLLTCNAGLHRGTFDFTDYERRFRLNSDDDVQFYASETDMQNNTNAITDISAYTAPITPTTIFVRVDNGHCYSTASFLLVTRNCPPTVYNFISANYDQTNDVFFIDGLKDIFVNYKLSIYNRWGKLIWIGDNTKPDWDGFAKKGLLINDSDIPDGTYFYELNLNDLGYPKPLTGYLYLTR